MKRHLCFVAALDLCIFASSVNAYAQQVRADDRGIAIGGSVTASTIISGWTEEQVRAFVRDATRPWEELTRQQRENITLLKGQLDLNERQLRAALSILGENDIPPERLAAKLVEVAERFKKLQATAWAQPNDDPKIAALKAGARKAIADGDLANADALLAMVETEQRRALDRLAVNLAETSAERGQIALTRLRYTEAATHYANAAAVLPPTRANLSRRLAYLDSEAEAFLRLGDKVDDTSALLIATERYKRIVTLVPRERYALSWAKVQTGLGIALTALGLRESTTGNLEEAIIVFREALSEHRRERFPLEWAFAQNGLGVALLGLGERENGTVRFEEAAVAFREALKERTRERVPLLWAATQNNLGHALVELGKRERGTAKLEEALVAYRQALNEYTRAREPLQWAATQNNLGLTLREFGARESGTGSFQEAVNFYREALKEATRELWPTKWAAVQNNLGDVLLDLGQRESDTASFEEAILAYREALKERIRERVPIEWAFSIGSEGCALMVLAERRRDVAMAETALRQINMAFETMRNGGRASSAAFYEGQLPRARATVERLRGR